MTISIERKTALLHALTERHLVYGRSHTIANLSTYKPVSFWDRNPATTSNVLEYAVIFAGGDSFRNFRLTGRCLNDNGGVDGTPTCSIGDLYFYDSCEEPIQDSHWSIIPIKQDKPRNKGTGRPMHGMKDIMPTTGLLYMIDGKLVLPRDYTVSPHLWHAREEYRFASGKYTPLSDAVWQGIHQEFDQRTISQINLQFPHYGLGDETMIAFTESPRKGYADRQTSVRAGKWFGQWTDDQALIKRLSNAHRTGKLGKGFELSFATGSDITDLYTESNIGSCMAYRANHFGTGGRHPVETYSSDFACAFINAEDCDTNDGGPVARAMVNVNEQTFSSLYAYQDNGTYKDTLKSLLEQAGYHHSSRYAEGCRLDIIQHNGGYIAPYVDGYMTEVWLHDNYLWLGDHPPVSHALHVGNSHASHETGGFCGYMGEPCSNCDDRFDSQNEGGRDRWDNLICQDCLDDSFHWSDAEDFWIHENDAQWCEPEQEWNSDDNCTQLDCGMHAGEYTHEDNRIMLHDDSVAHCEDLGGDVVETDSGDYALAEDCVTTIAGEVQLIDNCEYIDEEADYELTGTYYHGINIRECDPERLHSLYYKGVIQGNRFQLKDITLSPSMGFMPFDGIASAADELNGLFYIHTDNWTRAASWRNPEQQQTEVL